MEDSLKKVILGTVQFGLDYGISNTKGVVSTSDAEQMIDYFLENGGEYFDTAANYGESETIVKKLLFEKSKGKIITKVASFNNESNLEKFQKGDIYGLLLHDAKEVCSSYENLKKLKELGYVQKVGVSVYSERDILYTLEIFTPDIIQLPINVFDQKLLNSGILTTLKEKGVEIHARSLFLQGLVFMEDNLPRYFEPIQEKIKSFQQEMNETFPNLSCAALAFANQVSEIDYFVLGHVSLDQLKRTKEAMSYILNNTKQYDFSKFSIDEEQYTNPSLWPK